MDKSNSNNNPIRYVFIGDIMTCSALGELHFGRNIKDINPTYVIDSFRKISSEFKKNQVEVRTSIESENNNICHSIIKQNMQSLSPNYIFILVEAAQSSKPGSIFNLIDEIIKSGFVSNKHFNGSKNELNSDTMSNIRNFITSSKINDSIILEINNDVNSLKNDMNSAIKKQTKNLAKIETLEGQSKNVKNLSKQFKDDAIEVERITWWKNCKLWVIIIVIVIGLILVIVLPIVLTKKDDKKALI
jgi:hypothetical protein